MEKKPDGYKMWLSKQHTGHCGTRVQVGYYSGNPDGNVSRPNCGAKETAAHLCLCPNEDRVRLFTEGVDQLSKWLEGSGKTNLELQYWIPKYMKYRGTRRFQDMGQMSPNMRALAVSQDKIGWRNFMEGRVSKEFYQMQAQHSASSTSFLNGEDWVKQLISRILHITHSQWIFRNFSLHDKRQ